MKGRRGCTRRYSHNPGRNCIDTQDMRLQPQKNCVRELVLCIEP